MSYEVEGTLHKIYNTENKSGSFQTREFVVRVDGQYPQYVKLQLVQDRCNIIDNFQENSRVKVSFDLRGREWQDKFFTTLNAWRIEQAVDTTVTPSTPAPSGPPSFDTVPDNLDTGLPADFNDLPF
jgi:single-strand DNA-binding protein